MTKQAKIEFELEQDEDGYPPLRYERLWATPRPDGLYSIDSIPFFVVGISADDVVEADDIDGALRFRKLVRASGNSTFRVVVSAASDLEKVRAAIIAHGARCECNLQMGMLALEIASTQEIRPLLEYLVDERAKGVLDMEEGALRHALDADSST